MVKCMTELYYGIKFCVKDGEDEVTDFIEQKRGVRQSCSLCLYLLDIFTDDITDYIKLLHKI
jgi:hypothetical protein